LNNKRILIERFLHKATFHHNNDNVSQKLPIDGLAYFSGLNLLQSVLTDKNYHTNLLEGRLTTLPDHHEVFVKPQNKKSSDDKNYYILLAKIILTYRIDTAGNILYFFENFGSHNKMVLPKKDLKDKTGTLIIPYDLVVSVPKRFMPIDVATAFEQNPWHDCFSFKLSPSPATSLAINHDLMRQMAFMTHPKMLEGFIEDGNEEQVKSLYYDTRLALDLLKSKYNIDVSEKMLKELADIDGKLANINGSACIEII
jgi:hypothetical protein